MKILKNGFFWLILVLLLIVVVNFWRNQADMPINLSSDTNQNGMAEPLLDQVTSVPELGNDLQIEQMRLREYPASPITIEDELSPGSNYQRLLVSYQSEGNKIFALMTIPTGEKPATGWPVIIFNHGYIPPAQYRTTERYVAYVDGFARAGYIVFKSDYRGHGESEGEAAGGYGSPAYTVDILNALSSLKQYPDADPSRIGMWGHSMGGFITLRSMIISQDIKAGVIWGGVVASYPDLLNNWRRRSSIAPPPVLPSGARRWRDVLQDEYGTPEENPEFWASISANAFVSDISGPVQLHHARGDSSVPWEFSQSLADDLAKAGKEHQLYIYEGDDHDITQHFNQAMNSSVDFFDRYLKVEES